MLADREIVAFWCGTGQLGNPFGAMFRLLLLSAQRESEVAGMRWSEIDQNSGVWQIPGSRAKNGKTHIVHLSDLASQIIESVPRIAGQDLLFSGNGKTPVSGFSGAKARLDPLMTRALQEGQQKDTALAAWVLHDLRRTAVTGMARLGISPHVADRVLNHQGGTIRGVAAIYNRFEYLEERKAALQSWGRYMEGLIGRGAQTWREI